jgi:hypothetical protein
MDIERVNHIIETAIIGLQTEEIELLWERFAVPSPMQVAKKTGMALTVSPDDAMAGVDRAMAVLVHGRGKLTDPKRTPSSKEVVGALNELIEIVKWMPAKDRKEVMSRLRDWQKLARDHAKRMQQAAYSYRVGDVGTNDIGPARNIRDNLTDAIAIIAKYKGGGFMKKAGKTAAAKRKEQAAKEARAERSKKVADLQRIAQQSRADIIKGSRGQFPDKTVGTFVKILEAYLWKAVRDSKGSYSPLTKDAFWKRLMTVKRAAKADWNSEDKRDLRDLLKHVQRVFGTTKGIYSMAKELHTAENALLAFERTLERTIKTGDYPIVPHDLQLKLKKPDKRQRTMAFEHLRILKQSLAEHVW